MASTETPLIIYHIWTPWISHSAGQDGHGVQELVCILLDEQFWLLTSETSSISSAVPGIHRTVTMFQLFLLR